MFKLGMALVFAVIAALIIFLTGLFADARISTAFLRSLIGFFCAGACIYLITFILEAKGWAAFDKLAPERMSDMEHVVYGVDDIDFDADVSGDEHAKDFAAPTQFRPLAEEGLVHMRTPETEDVEGAAPAEAATPA